MKKIGMRLPAGRRSGFTLIEILIALTVLVIGLVGILALFPVGISSSKSAVEDSTTSILAESIKSSIIQSFRLAPPQPSGGAVPIQYYHDGVPTGMTFNLPGAGASTWVPVDATNRPTRSVNVIWVGSNFDYPSDLPSIDGGLKEEGDILAAGEPNPYDQYAYKFQVQKVTSASVDNLYLIVMYIYRQYSDTRASGGKDADQNEAVNVFSTMVAAN